MGTGSGGIYKVGREDVGSRSPRTVLNCTYFSDIANSEECPFYSQLCFSLSFNCVVTLSSQKPRSCIDLPDFAPPGKLSTLASRFTQPLQGLNTTPSALPRGREYSCLLQSRWLCVNGDSLHSSFPRPRRLLRMGEEQKREKEKRWKRRETDYAIRLLSDSDGDSRVDCLPQQKSQCGGQEGDRPWFQ